MTSKEIAERVTSLIVYNPSMNRTITNFVFLIIQNDQELMPHYLRAVQNEGLDTVNQTIGSKVKEAYSLTNADEREEHPTSTLIKSHQIFL